jgi:hypothetical protein
VSLGDWPDGDGLLNVPERLHEFDAGDWCVGHEHGPGAEALSEILWLHWCARVGDLLVAAYYKDPIGFFVAVAHVTDGRTRKELRLRPPRDELGAESAESFPRQRSWARLTAMAAAEDLRAAGGVVAGSQASEDAAWLRRQLGGLGRRP